MSLKVSLSNAVSLAAISIAVIPNTAFAQEGGGSSQAAAQSALPSDSQPQSVGEDIIVSGRRNRELAQQEQQASTTISSVVSGDALRSQPQTNLADLLSELPGLSASVDQSRNQAGTGEAQYLTIRGLDTSYNAYMVNGVRMAQTDSHSRAISMDLLAPYGISTVKIDKAPGADMDGDAIAGIVDVHTASAFDFTRPMTRIHFVGTFSEMASDAGQKDLGGIVEGEFGRRFADDRFGIYLNAYYQKKDNAADAVAMQNQPEILNTNIPGTIRDNPDNVNARGVQWDFYRNKISRYGGSLSLDFRPSETTQFYLRSNYGAYNTTITQYQSSIRQQLVKSGGDAYQISLRPTGFQASPNPGGGNYNAAGMAVDYGIMGGEYIRTEDSQQSLFSSKVGGSTKSDALEFDFSGAYSRGRQIYPRRIQAAFYGFPYIGTPNQAGTATGDGALITTINGKDPRVLLSPGAQAYVTNLSNISNWYVEQGNEYSRVNKLDGSGDLTWKMEDSLFLQGGVKYERSTRNSNAVAINDENRYFLEYNPATGGYTNNPDRPYWAPGGLTAAQFPGQILNSFIGKGPQVPIKLLDEATIRQLAAQYSLSLPLSGTILNKNVINGTETRFASYVMLKYKTDRLIFEPGVRFEHNSFSANYFESQNGALTPASSESSYNEVLPSALLTYRPDDRVVLRGAIRKSYARPAFDQLLGPTQITTDITGAVTAITQPNANLKPVTAINYDFNAEYYGPNNTTFQVSTYYKSLNNVIFATGTTNTASSANDGTVTNSVNGVQVSTLSNGGDGFVMGMELAARRQLKELPGLLSGFGISGNLTLQKTKATILVGTTNRRLPLIRAPNELANIELFYAGNHVNASLLYRIAGTQLILVRNTSPDVYEQPTKLMNFTVSYVFNNGLTLGAAVENVLNNASYWTTYGRSATFLSADRDGGYVNPGRQFQVSASFNF